MSNYAQNAKQLSMNDLPHPLTALPRFRTAADCQCMHVDEVLACMRSRAGKAMNSHKVASKPKTQFVTGQAAQHLKQSEAKRKGRCPLGRRP